MTQFKVHESDIYNRVFRCKKAFNTNGQTVMRSLLQFMNVAMHDFNSVLKSIAEVFIADVPVMILDDRVSHPGNQKLLKVQYKRELLENFYNAGKNFFGKALVSHLVEGQELPSDYHLRCDFFADQMMVKPFV